MQRDVTKSQTFLCTRPSLTELLISNGYKYDLVHNPFDANKKAWLFNIDDNLAAIVSGYYKSIDQDVPSSIRKYEQMHQVQRKMK